MTAAYDSSGYFGSKVRSRSIVHNKYSGRTINFSSKPTSIHGPIRKSILNYSYLRSHFSQLPKAVSKKLIYRLSQKVSYDYKIIDTFINEFITN